jgi:RimJ/RimL family protein N-acetyltransferase
VSGLAGAKPPERVTLEGRYARLEPIAPLHAEDVFVATTDDNGSRYRWLFMYPPASVAEMRERIDVAAAKSDPLTFAVVDRGSGRALGQQSLMRVAPADGCIEIGGITWGQGLVRTRLATEALYLHARYVFDDLGYRRFEWKCNNLNDPSKAAAKRFGFTFEGIFRQHMIVKGENRDTAWFSMLDGEWPRLKAGYERWLDPSNFDADGMQKTKLRF